MLTQEEIQEAMPSQLQAVVTPELVQMINDVSTDPEAAKIIRDNFISYTGVMRDGKFKLEDYINAISFVSFKLMGNSNKEAYRSTFPARYKILVSRGASSKDISSYVSSYAKNKLVNLLLEQTLVPVWILNQDSYQEAINTQVALMTSAKSEMVRTNAANSLLTHLKRPEVHKVELDIGVKETSGMAELRALLTSVAERQQELIGQGVSTREIAHQQMIDVNAEDAEELSLVSK